MKHTNESLNTFAIEENPTFGTNIAQSDAPLHSAESLYVTPSSRSERGGSGGVSPPVVTRPECMHEADYYYCNSCSKVHSRPHTCNERFCSKCYPFRFKRNFARLMEYDIKVSRLIHIVVGFPHDGDQKPDIARKKELEKILVKWHGLLRKNGVQCRGMRIFDLADDGSYDHFHYALIPESGRFPVNKARELIIKASKGSIQTLSVFGYRSKKALLGYFAKRTAGMYGHGGDSFFLEDIMSFEEYKTKFFNVRTVVILSSRLRRLTCNIAQSHLGKGMKCPFCGSEDLIKIETLKMGDRFKPPPWVKMGQDDKFQRNMEDYVSSDEVSYGDFVQGMMARVTEYEPGRGEYDRYE